jgi:nitrite reductase (NO-forming)
MLPRARSGSSPRRPRPRPKDLEHHNIPASAAPIDPDTVQAKLNFESKCLACHSVGQGKKLGPDVAGVTRQRSDDWLFRWMKSPEKMLETDADAKAMLKEYNNIPMPNQNLSDTEIKQYIKYFHWIDSSQRALRRQRCHIENARCNP